MVFGRMQIGCTWILYAGKICILELMMYQFTYSGGITQKKILVSHSDWGIWRSLPEQTDEQIAVKESFWDEKTKGQPWFTDKSPLYDAIETGILNCNGKHSVTIIQM